MLMYLDLGGDGRARFWVNSLIITLWYLRKLQNFAFWKAGYPIGILTGYILSTTSVGWYCNTSILGSIRWRQRFRPLKCVNWNFGVSHLPEVCWKGRTERAGREGGNLNFLLPTFIQWSACWAFPSRSVPKNGEGCYKENPLEKDEILNGKT
jgi:hypothetical protein